MPRLTARVRRRLRRRRAERRPEGPGTHIASLEDVRWRRFDFVDLGCSTGGSLRWAQQAFAARRGLGVDLNERKVAQTVEAGYDAVVADATRFAERGVVRFVTMMDFLEHLPGLDVVEAVIERSAAMATDFLFIRHPSFEGEAYAEELGLRQFWWHWRAHTVHPQVADYLAIFERLGLDQVTIRYRERIDDSSHRSVLPLEAPVDQHAYDPALHPPKPAVRFRTPLWRAQDILVPLRTLSATAWREVVGAVDRRAAIAAASASPEGAERSVGAASLRRP